MIRQIDTPQAAATHSLDDATAQNPAAPGSTTEASSPAPRAASPARSSRLDSPPAYDAYDRMRTPVPQSLPEKAPLLPPAAGGWRGSSSSIPHVGTSASAAFLPAPLSQGMRYVRKQLIDAPRLRQEVITQAEVLMRQAALAQLADEPHTALMLYDAAFAALERVKSTAKERHRLILGLDPDGTVPDGESSDSSPLLLALRRDGNDQVLVRLCAFWGENAVGCFLDDWQMHQQKRMLINAFCLPWLERQCKESLRHIRRGNDEYAANRLQSLETTIAALETRLGPRTYWVPNLGALSPQKGFKSTALTEVILFGPLKSELDGHADSNRQLLRLLRENACDRSTAVFLRHDHGEKNFTAAYVELQVDNICAAAKTGQPAPLHDILGRIQRSQAQAGVQVMTNRNGALKRLLETALGVEVETRTGNYIFGTSTVYDGKTYGWVRRDQFLTFDANTSPQTWFAIAVCFGLKSSDIWLRAMPGAEDRQLVWLRDNSAPEESPVSTEMGHWANASATLPEFRTNEQQAPQFLAWALIARQAAEVGRRWSEPMGLEMLDRLCTALADEAEREQAQAFVRGLMDKHPTPPTSLMLALTNYRQTRAPLPADIDAWLDAGDEPRRVTLPPTKQN